MSDVLSKKKSVRGMEIPPFSQGTVYGYARVSTKEQNEERQLFALRSYPVEEKRIYVDKVSGKDFNRPQYRKLIKRLQEGDILVVKSIDRLGRNYEEILNQWRHITKERRADIVVLDMPLLNTRKVQRDLTGTFMSDLVLQILSYVAETERENIRQRQKEGIRAAKQRGVHFGRPRKKIPEKFYSLKKEWESGHLTSREAARCLEIAQDTFLRWVKENNRHSAEKEAKQAAAGNGEKTGMREQEKI